MASASGKVWVVGNPTSGGGKGESQLNALLSGLEEYLGAASVVSVEWRGENTAPLASGPIATVIRTTLPQQGTEICRWIVRQQLPRILSTISLDGSANAIQPLLDLICVVGGDGTLSECVNGLCCETLVVCAAHPGIDFGSGSSKRSADSALLTRFLPRVIYLPSGTGADFARLGICCRSPEDVVRVIQSTIRSNPLASGSETSSAVCEKLGADFCAAAPFSAESCRVDIGSVFFLRTGQRRYFINECSVGISCDVILRSERYKQSWLRRLGGTVVFFAAALVALIQLKPIKMRLRRLPSDGDLSEAATEAASSFVRCRSGKDGRVVRLTPDEIRGDCETVGHWVDFPASTIAFGNGKFFGGGMKAFPHGDPTDQLLAVTAWYATFWPFILRLYGVYSGSHVKWGSTTTLEGSRFEVDVGEGAAKQYCETDGELAESLPAIVEIFGSLTLLRPLSGRK